MYEVTMKSLKYILITFSCLLFLNSSPAQNIEYPDSLKTLVIKIEPLSFLFGHFSGGVELPLGKSFLDINVGLSGVGLPANAFGTGGWSLKWDSNFLYV